MQVKRQNDPRLNQKKKIIATASALMSRYGYKAVSLDKIVEEVGIHKSTFFHYFKTKEELLLEVLKPGIQEVFKNLSRIESDPTLTPKEKLFNAISNHLNLLSKYKENVNVFHSETRFLSPKNRKEALQAREDYALLFEKLIEQLVASDPDRFHNLDPKIVTFAVLGMCNWFLKWHRRKGRYTINEIAEMFSRLIVGQTLRGNG